MRFMRWESKLYGTQHRTPLPASYVGQKGDNIECTTSRDVKIDAGDWVIRKTELCSNASGVIERKK